MTFTKERLQKLIRAIDCENYDEEEIVAWVNSDEILELARMALTALTAEPVGEVVLGEYDDSGCHPDAKVVCIAADGQADWENFKDGTRLYAAPQLPQPAVPFGFTDGDAHGMVYEPRHADRLANPMPVYRLPPQPAVEPHPVSAVKGELAFIDHFERIIGERDGDIDIGQLGRGNYDALMLAALDAFRAAMLQGGK